LALNGSGKSLLAKVTCSLEKPESGQFFKMGKPYKSNQRQRGLSFRMIFQNSNESLNPGMTLGSYF